MASAISGLPNEWLKHAPKPRPLRPGENWNVFLSYRSVNRAWVLNLYDILCQQGCSVFIDQCALKAGDPLIRRLQDALSTSQSGVLVWSRATEDSEWVAREYETLERLATEKKDFIFVPVALDGSKLPAFAGSRIYLDFSSYPDGPNGGELLRLIYALAGRPLSPEAADFALEQDEAAQIAAVKIGAALRNGRPERMGYIARIGLQSGRGAHPAESKRRCDYNSRPRSPALPASRPSKAVIRPGTGAASRGERSGQRATDSWRVVRIRRTGSGDARDLRPHLDGSVCALARHWRPAAVSRSLRRGFRTRTR